jgi:hypothetical protein
MVELLVFVGKKHLKLVEWKKKWVIFFFFFSFSFSLSYKKDKCFFFLSFFSHVFSCFYAFFKILFFKSIYTHREKKYQIVAIYLIYWPTIIFLRAQSWRFLKAKWNQTSRLETRTEEYNMYASIKNVKNFLSFSFFLSFFFFFESTTVKIFESKMKPNLPSWNTDRGV